jgi:hypothetical protein
VWSEDKSVRDGFREQYKEHALAVERYYTNIRVKFVFTEEYANGGGRSGKGEAKYTRSNFVISGESVRTKNGKPNAGANPSRVVEGRNNHYSFTLKPLADQQYLLEHLTFHHESGPTALCFLSAPFADYLRKQTFLEMAENQELKFLAFKDCVWQNKSMKELQVRFVVVNSRPRQKTDVTASYYFSVEDGWVCCGKRYHAVSAPPSEYHETSYVYGPRGSKQFGDLTRIEVLNSDEQKPRKFSSREVTEILEFEHCAPFPDSDFTLSVFGLPDPMGVPKPDRPTRWYLWLSLGAFVCLLLAAVSWRLTRSKQQTGAGSMPRA